LGDFPLQLARNAKAMYVYTDIISPTHVSNTYTPLLKVVPFKANEGKVTFSSKLAQYMKICKNYITTIHTQIRDEEGEPFPFIKYCKTMVVLHLKKQ